MLDAPVVIRDAGELDAAQWHRLWRLYQDFYGAALSDEVTHHTWVRILDPASPVFGLVAVQDAGLTGFAVGVIHEATWTLTPVCYLEDLFVAPEARRTGTGMAIMQELLNRARAAGWSRLYWHTQADNEMARRLYDRFCPADGFVRYRLMSG